MAAESEPRRRARAKPVATFRTSWQMLMVLDSLAELEGSSRGRIINAALFEYSQDYIGVRGRMNPDFLANMLRRIDVLQHRIEAGLQQAENGGLGELQENRRDLLREAYRYALYTSTPDSYELLSRAASWLTCTFKNANPPETQTSELRAKLEALLDHHTARANDGREENGAKQAPL